MSGRHEKRLTGYDVNVACGRDFCTGNAVTSRHTQFGWKAACEKHREWLASLPASPAVTHTGDK